MKSYRTLSNYSSQDVMPFNKAMLPVLKLYFAGSCAGNSGTTWELARNASSQAITRFSELESVV